MEQIVNDNPQLNWWFTAANNAKQRIIARAQKCLKLENPDNQRLVCFQFTCLVRCRNSYKNLNSIVVTIELRFLCELHGSAVII